MYFGLPSPFVCSQTVVSHLKKITFRWGRGGAPAGLYCVDICLIYSGKFGGYRGLHNATIITENTTDVQW